MANRDDSSSTTCTVRVLVSFYLVATDDSSSARTSPIPKEKFNVPLSGNEHKDLLNFVTHLKAFTGLADTKIRLFNVFFWERKVGFGKLMKNVWDAGFSQKRGGNAGSGPPLPDPEQR